MLGGAYAIVLDRLPLPLAAVRPLMLVENAVENARGGWARLRGPSEQPRYAAVRRAVEAYAREGSVLDLGCSQAVLREGLTCRRYTGVDADAGALARNRVADLPGTGAPGGVLVVCCYARTWPTRQLLVRLARRLELVSTERVAGGRHAWDVAVLRAPGARRSVAVH